MRTLGEGSTLRQDNTGDIRIEGLSGSGPITVMLEGETYVLERDPNNTTFASFREDDVTIQLRTVVVASDYAFGLSLFGLDGDTLNSGRFVAGYDTNPADLARVAGTADFNGGMAVALRNGFDLAAGNGDITLTVDFDANTISGTGTLIDLNDANADFNFDPIAVSFDTTKYSGNGFTGTISAPADDIDGTLTDATYSGRFYGPDAESAGGQITGLIEREGQEQGTFIDGVFLGSQ